MILSPSVAVCVADTALGKHIGAQRNSSNAYVVAIDR